MNTSRKSCVVSLNSTPVLVFLTNEVLCDDMYTTIITEAKAIRVLSPVFMASHKQKSGPAAALLDLPSLDLDDSTRGKQDGCEFRSKLNWEGSEPLVTSQAVGYMLFRVLVLILRLTGQDDLCFHL